jgi:hypothetical protein
LLSSLKFGTQIVNRLKRNSKQQVTKKIMKKFLAIIATVALFAIILSSCKSHELCPAYGKVDAKAKTAKQV